MKDVDEDEGLAPGDEVFGGPFEGRLAPFVFVNGDGDEAAAGGGRGLVSCSAVGFGTLEPHFSLHFMF